MNDKALIKLSETHERLVKGLKNALKLGQLGFLHAGKFLYKIWSQKTFLSEDSSREVTFTEFCARPDLPIPGSSEESRLRTMTVPCAVRPEQVVKLLFFYFGGLWKKFSITIKANSSSCY